MREFTAFWVSLLREFPVLRNAHFKEKFRLQQSQQIRPHAQTNPRASLSQQLQKSSASKPNNPSIKPKQPQTGKNKSNAMVMEYALKQMT